MTREVLAQGDDRPDGPGRGAGLLVVVVLVAVAAVAFTRSRGEPAARPAPSAAPSSAVGVPDGPEGPDGPDGPVGGPEAPDPFAESVTVRRPPPGVLSTVLLPGGVPGFLLPDEELPGAVAAVGGPPHAQVLVGWCAGTRLFQDDEGTVFYDEHGTHLTPGMTPLPQHQVRRSVRDQFRVEVAGRAVTRTADRTFRPSPKCRERLFFPRLPKRAARVHDTVAGHLRLRGRYVVTTETRAFCRAGGGPSCASDGWEVYRPGTLPPRELAGSYTWEGEFLVRGGTDGSLSVVRLPGTRLVKRERLGRMALVGLADSVRRVGGRDVLRFNPMEQTGGETVDTSPAGTAPDPAPEWTELMTDRSGAVREYPLRRDVEVILGPGITGLGRARGTAATLREFLKDAGHRRQALWVVVDEADRVLRVVIAT